MNSFDISGRMIAPGLPDYHYSAALAALRFNGVCRRVVATTRQKGWLDGMLSLKPLPAAELSSRGPGIGHLIWLLLAALAALAGLPHARPDTLAHWHVGKVHGMGTQRKSAKEGENRRRGRRKAERPKGRKTRLQWGERQAGGARLLLLGGFPVWTRQGERNMWEH